MEILETNTLIDALQKLLEDRADRILANSILGTVESRKIAEDINRFCMHKLGQPVMRCLYAGFSVGASFGLELMDGRQVFMKVHKLTSPDTITANSRESLAACSFVQQSLARGGFPCPAVLLTPSEFGEGIATVDVYASPGEQKDAHNATIRQTMAQTLAELIQRTEPYKLLPGAPLGRFCESKTLYPIPHNALFDFENTSNGAEWIDEIASKAKTTIAENRSKERTVLGHVDWSLKHFRFEDTKVAMIYDWDSLKLEDELYILGLAAATFPTSWDIPVKITPSQEESYEFVREYEYCGGKNFTKQELRIISAAATYCMAYVSRCEFAINPNNEKYEGSFRQALQGMIGDTYLSL